MLVCVGRDQPLTWTRALGELSALPVAAIREKKPDVAVLCTSSSLKKVWPQIETVLKKKVPIWKKEVTEDIPADFASLMDQFKAMPKNLQQQFIDNLPSQ